MRLVIVAPHNLLRIIIKLGTISWKVYSLKFILIFLKFKFIL